MTRLGLATLAGILAISLSVPARAGNETDVFNRIEHLHGNAQAFEEALYRLTQALRADDASALADLSSFPLKVDANGERYDILAP